MSRVEGNVVNLAGRRITTGAGSEGGGGAHCIDVLWLSGHHRRAMAFEREVIFGAEEGKGKFLSHTHTHIIHIRVGGVDVVYGHPALDGAESKASRLILLVLEDGHTPVLVLQRAVWLLQ